MSRERPDASVVVPTCNRRVLLSRALDALSRQRHPMDRFEVLVVIDGSTDDTAEMLESYRAPFALRVIEQRNEGPAAARNRGAAESRGSTLIFLDDDLEACPDLVGAHVSLRESPNEVLLGYYPVRECDVLTYLAIELRTWWEAMFDAMRQPGHRFEYRDLLSGNFSLDRDLFHRVGGFDPRYRCHEDYELGVRLLKAGASLRFAPEAVAIHNELSDAPRSIQRKFDEGRADVRIARDHPDLVPVLPLAARPRTEPLGVRVLRETALRAPASAELLSRLLSRGLRLMERRRLRHFWTRLLDSLLYLGYWRGVASELGTRRGLAELLASSERGPKGNASSCTFDLAAGLEAAEAELDRERPSEAMLYLGRHRVGLLPWRPGAEPWKGSHLRAALASTLSVPLLRALILEGRTDPSPDVARALELLPVPAAPDEEPRSRSAR